MNLDLTECKQNIISCYNSSSLEDRHTGLAWYTTANTIAQILADKNQLKLEVVCGVIAALSPGSKWDMNVKNTTKMIDFYKSGMKFNDMPKIGSYGTRNMEKAFRILSGFEVNCVLGGLKVNNFYACILKPKNVFHVCVDRHATSIAVSKRLGDKYTKYSLSQKKYNFIADAYKVAAEELDLIPNQLQAITWCSWRRIHTKTVDNFMVSPNNLL